MYQIKNGSYFRQIEARERLSNILNQQLEMVKMRDDIQQALTACKYPQHMHEAAKKYQEVFNQIFGFVEKLAQVPAVTLTEKSTILRLC